MRGVSKKYADITSAQIEACSQRLKPSHLKILRSSMGSNYPEMAKVLEINIGTVKSRLHRARAALAAELKKTCLSGLDTQTQNADSDL